MTEAEEELAVDPRWYRSTYADIQWSGLTPEEHYRRVGRHIGRRPGPDPAPLEPRLAPASPGAPSEARPVAPTTPGDAPADRPSRAHPPSDGSLLVAAPDDLWGPPDDATPPDEAGEAGPRADAPVLAAGGVAVARAGDEDAAARLWPTLAAFCELSALGAPTLRPDGAAPAMTGAASLPTVVGAALRTGPQALVDLWFGTTHGLTLLFGGAEGRGGGATVRVLQADSLAGGAVAEVGRGRLAAVGPTLVEAVLRNPLWPVLVVLDGADGAALALGLLAFPSLARGGAHQAEVAALEDGDATPATLWAYAAARLGERAAVPRARRLARLVVSTQGATGAEAVFSSAVRAWLDLMGVGLDVAAPADPDRARLLDALGVGGGAAGAAGPALLLPPDALCTVAALTADLGVGDAAGPLAAVPYLVADRGTGRPRWAVAPARGAAALGPLQAMRLAAPLHSGGEAPPLPLAIVQRDARAPSILEALLPASTGRPALVGPAPRGRAGVTCVLAVEEPAAARRLLATLAAQEDGGEVRLLAHGTVEDRDRLGPDLDRHLPGRWGWLGKDGLSAARLAELAGDDALLLMEDRAILHDPRTLGVLRAALATGRTASAAAVVLHEEPMGRAFALRSESGGYFPARIGFFGGPHLRFDTPDTLLALPGQTYPVAANALAAALIEPAALREVAEILDGLDPGTPSGARGPDALALDPLLFGLATLSRGWDHLCTSVVRVGTSRPRRRGGRTDPAALRAMAPSRWEDLLGRVTLLRELR